MPDPERCRYAKTHEWAARDGAQATVGISEHAQREITDVVFVELPKPGRRVKAGEPCAVVESVKAAFDVYAPLTGEIVSVNEEVARDPALVNLSPHDKGWFFTLKVSDPEGWDALMDKGGYERFLRSGAGAAH